MKKIFIIIVAILFNCSIFALDLYLPKAPPSLPLTKAVDSIPAINLQYYTDVNTEVVPNIIKNKDALYVLPVNTGAQLFNKGKDLKLIGVLSEGLISIISSKTYSNIKGLSGQEIYIGGQGSSPDVISNYIFRENNIKVKTNYRTSQEIAKLIMTGKIDTAILPEPLASQVIEKNKNLKRVFILKNEWTKLNGQKSIPQVGIFGTEDVLTKNKALITNLIKEYKKSLIWMNSNKTEAAKYGIEVFQVSLSPAAFEDSIDNMNLVFVEGLSSKASVDTYLKALMSVDTESVDKIPGVEFYKK